MQIFQSFSYMFFIKVFGKKIRNLIRSPINKLLSYAKLKDASFNVNFADEGNTLISLPRVGLFNALVSKHGSKLLNKCTEFSTRPYHEKLLRKIVFNLYSEGLIDKKKSIIDIGCWISDNAIVWAKNLNDQHGFVHAIDPSLENLSFGELLKEVNSINNIYFHHAVCADIEGAHLNYEGGG